MPSPFEERAATTEPAASANAASASLLSDSLVFVSVPASFADLPSDVRLCVLDFVPSEADRQSLRHVDSRFYNLVPLPSFVDSAGNVIKSSSLPEKRFPPIPKEEDNGKALAWALGAEQVDFLERYYKDLPEEDGAHEDRNREKHIGVTYFIGASELPTTTGGGGDEAPEDQGWVKVVGEKGKMGRMVCRWCRLVVPCEAIPGRDGRPSSKKKCKACGAMRWW